MGIQPISFSFEPHASGAHIRVTVRCGPDGSRALCGELMMRPGEWSLLRWLLDTTPPLPTLNAYVPHWVPDDDKVRTMCHTPIDTTPIVVHPDRWPEKVIARFDAAVEAAQEAAT